MSTAFVPKKPVKSFLDLEVYQKALECAVFVAKYIAVPPPALSAVRSESQGDAVPSGSTGHAATSGNFGSGTSSADVESRPSGLVPRPPFVSKDDGSPEPKVQTGHPPNGGQRWQGDAGMAKELIFHQMLPCALGLPHLIAAAHSVRFGSQKDCLILLERAMLHCNKMVVYLEETRDIADTGVPFEKFSELTKKYLYLRQKMLNLQRSWKKYMSEK
jgi:hypothetical protein